MDAVILVRYKLTTPVWEEQPWHHLNAHFQALLQLLYFLLSKTPKLTLSILKLLSLLLFSNLEIWISTRIGCPTSLWLLAQLPTTQPRVKYLWLSHTTNLLMIVSFQWISCLLPLLLTSSWKQAQLTYHQILTTTLPWRSTPLRSTIWLKRRITWCGLLWVSSCCAVCWWASWWESRWFLSSRSVMLGCFWSPNKKLWWCLSETSK